MTRRIQLKVRIIQNIETRLGAMTLETIIIVSSSGRLSQISKNRCMARSNQPPKYPCKAPIIIPITELASVSARPNRMERRKP